MPIFKDFNQEIAAASARSAVAARAGNVAAAATAGSIQRFLQSVERHPRLPADVHLAVMNEPNSEELIDQIALEYPRTEPQQLTARQARIARVGQQLMTAGSMGRQPGPSMVDQLNEQMGTRFGERNMYAEAPVIAGQMVDRGVRALPGGDTVMNALVDTVRPAMVPLQYPEQYAQGLGRDAMSLIRPNAEANAAMDAWWQYPVGRPPVATAEDQTDLGVAFNQAMDDVHAGRLPQIDLGDGYFTSEESDVFRQRQINERTMGTLPNGQTYTVGRSVAYPLVSTGLIDPEGDVYNAISGVVDAAVMIGAPGPELAIGRAAQRTYGIGIEAAGGISQTSGSAGIMGGLYRQVRPDRFSQFIHSGRAQRAVDFLVDARGDRGWNAIWQATNGSITPRMTTLLTEADNAEDVRLLLEAAFGTGQRVTLRTSGGRLADRLGNAAADRSPTMRRLFGDATPGMVDLRDPTQFTQTVDSMARDFKFGSDDVDEWVARAGRTSSETERFTVYEDFLARSMESLSTDHGVNREAARAMTQFMADDLNTTRALADDMILMSENDWAFRNRLGDEAAPIGAFLLSERAHMLPTPNVRQIRRATSEMRPFFELSQAGVEGRWVSAPKRDAAGRIITEEVVKRDELGRALRDADGRVVTEQVPVMRRVDAVQASRRLANLFGSGWVNTTTGYMWMQSNVWKPSRLLRMGYTLRVTPEEFGRRIWDGQTWVTHPGGIFSLFADTRKSDDLTRLLTGRKGMGSISEELIDLGDGRTVSVAAGFTADDLQRVTVNAETLSGLRDPYTSLRDALRTGSPVGGRSTSGFSTDTIGARWGDGSINKNFTSAWQEELQRLSSDIITQRVARDGVDETWRWLLQPPDADSARGVDRLTAAALQDESLRAAEDNWFLMQLHEMHARNGTSALDDAEGLRLYLDSVSNRIKAVSGGDDDLLRVIRRGTWDDNIDLTRKVENGVNPPVVPRPTMTSGDTPGQIRRWLSGFFEGTVAIPSNFLNRIPAFNSSYERAIVELAPLGDNVDDLVRGAQRAGLRGSALDAVRQGARGEGLLRASQIDLLARKYAADQTQQLLFDVSMRSNFFENFRIMFPFGEAWREVVTTWGRLMRDQPAVALRYGGMVAREGTTGDAGQTYLSIMGVDKEAEGFFYQDQYGETSFFYPGSNLPFLAAGLPGGGFEGAVSNLNLAGEIAPGADPMVQIPLDMVLPDTKAWDRVRGLIFPFGEPPKPLSTANWLPTWFAKFLDEMNEGAFGGRLGFTNDESANRIANRTMAVTRALASTGQYNLSDEADVRRMFEDARGASLFMGIFQAGVQAATPTSPKSFYDIIGPNGENVEMAVALQDLYDLYEEDPQNAVVRWITDYGLNNILMTQGFTTTTAWGGMPLHQEGWNWYREYPEMSEKYPNIYGLFSPGEDITEGDPDDFVNEAYDAQKESGERIPLSPEQWFALAQNKVASSIYSQIRAAVYNAAGGSLNEDQRALLAAERGRLTARFPGWRSVQNVGGRTPVRQIMDEFETAYQDEQLTRTPAGQAFRMYWEARGIVVAMADSEGLVSSDPYAAGGWREAGDGFVYRESLRGLLDQLAVAEPDFAEMAEVLALEFDDDEED